ncbi:60S ribosomal protein L24-like [Medicago truncatula]|uniref:60S ribosomal protein L24-like n=1 Tax=Medicago truncatula TaxID=3880 RepID=UPI000D2F184D|nr:60S ribosomal protein L24-like [Medicago truncatula]
MYGGALPVAKSRKTKSKALSKEEYLVEEAPRKPSKRSKKADQNEVAAPKTKRGKTVKTESSTVSVFEVVIQKKRNREPEVQDVAREASLCEDATRRESALRLSEAKEQREREAFRSLKAAGYELDAEKAAVIASLAAEIEEETVKEGAALLK